MKLSEFFATGTSLAVLPPVGVPRLATPATSMTGRRLDGALFPASRTTARVAVSLMSLACGIGAVPRAMGNAAPDMVRLISAVTARAPGVDHYVAILGNPGATQKATLVLRDARNGVVAYCKIGWSTAARELVRREASVIRHLEPEIGPSLVYTGESGPLSAVVVTPLDGDEPPLDASVPAVLIDRAACCVSIVVGEHPVVREMVRESPEEMGALLPVMRNVEVGIGVSHGDAAPWNARRDSAGRVRLFDWEYGRIDGFPSMDVAHWSIQVGHLSRGLRPADALAHSCVEVARSLGLTTLQAAGLCGITALDVANRLTVEGKLAESEWWRVCTEAAIRFSQAEGS